MIFDPTRQGHIHKVEHTSNKNLDYIPVKEMGSQQVWYLKSNEFN